MNHDKNSDVITKNLLIDELKHNRIAQIAKKYGVSDYVIRKKIEEYQIPLHLLQPPLSEKLIRYMTQMYFKNTVIAKVFHCSVQNIRNFKTQNNITDPEDLYINRDILIFLLEQRVKLVQIAEVLGISRTQLSQTIAADEELKKRLKKRNFRELSDSEMKVLKRKCQLHQSPKGKSTL